MIKIKYDGEYKGNVYTLYSDGWYCSESTSNRYRWLKPCIMVQSRLNRIALSEGYCLKPRKVEKEQEVKAKSKSTSKKTAKSTSKTFVSLF